MAKDREVKAQSQIRPDMRDATEKTKEWEESLDKAEANL